MFVDYPHKNKLLTLNNKKVIKKTLADNKILEKEFKVLKFLAQLELSPKAINYNGKSYYEEYIDGERLGNNLKDETIVSLARTITKYHSLNLPLPIKDLVDDNLVVCGRYKPSTVFKEIAENILANKDKKLYQKLFDFMLDMDSYYSKVPYKLGLVHGDLSGNNIIINQRGIHIIDWSDCRYDILSCDISQLFYLNTFSEEQEKKFLLNYKVGFIDKKILSSHKILLLLFDVADIYRKTKNWDVNRIKTIERTVNNL